MGLFGLKIVIMNLTEINLLVFDNANNLWIGSEKGINKIIFELKDTLGHIKYIVNKFFSYIFIYFWNTNRWIIHFYERSKTFRGDRGV